jgi:hypothetical protein
LATGAKGKQNHTLIGGMGGAVYFTARQKNIMQFQYGIG